MSNQDTKIRAAEKLPTLLEALPVLQKPYCGQINEALVPWLIYLEDAGHSIFAILADHEDKAFNGDPPEYLVPVPVKSVMRGYEVRDGYIVACAPEIKYDPVLGLITLVEDSEY